MELYRISKCVSCVGLASILVLLGACSAERASLSFPPNFAEDHRFTEGDFLSPVQNVQQGLPIEDFYPENIEKQQDKKTIIRLGLGREESKNLGCDLGDRFDNSAALSYQFDDRQSRLSLHLSLDGPSLTDPSNLEFNSVMVRFTHKFQKPPRSKDKKCLFPSNVQGLAGSIYHEFFIRNNYTILDELKDRGLDLK